MLKRIALTLAGLCVAGAAGAQSTESSSAQSLEPIDSIVAVVNDDVVLKSELDQAVERVRQQFGSRVNLPPRNVLERQVLDRLILMELQLQTARQNNLRVTEDEVDQALERMAMRNNVTVAQLRQSLIQEGLSFAELRETVREQIIIDKMQSRVAERRVDVTDSEVDIQLEQQPADNREYHLATILTGVPDGASPDQVRQAQAEAERLYRELRGGRDFEQAAIAVSDAQNALQGGDLGWRRAEQIPPQFAELVRNMDPGDVARPIRAAGGFYILKLIEDRPAQPFMVTERRARHLLISPDELMSDQQAYEKIIELRRQIVEGETEFAAAAKEHSDDLVTGAKGGDMGWFGPGQFGTRIDQVIASLKKGELSQPFRTEGGWHIVQLLDERRVDRTEEQRRARAREALRERKRQDEIENWIRQLRAESYVDIRLSG